MRRAAPDRASLGRTQLAYSQRGAEIVLPTLIENPRLGSEMGNIETGKRGDLVVTDGDRLQIVTRVERAFMGGREVTLESKHTRLSEEFKDRH